MGVPTGWERAFSVMTRFGWQHSLGMDGISEVNTPYISIGSNAVGNRAVNGG